MLPIKILFGLLLLSGCVSAVKPSAQVTVAPKIVTVTQTKVVLKYRYIRTPIPESELTCPADPVFPKIPDPTSMSIYMAGLLATADQCRANLAAIGH